MVRIASAIVAIACSVAPAAAADLESALLDRARGLVKHCKDRGYKTVGVLKFLAAKEDGDFSDNLGTVNTLLARRLEVALVLANDPRNPIGIVDNASATAAKTPGANHLTPDGRAVLLAARYRLAWGDPRVKFTPDAFLTGAVQVSKDLKTLRISFFFFDQKATTFQAVPGVPDAVVANRGSALAELGESFTLRGAFDDGKVGTKAKGTAETKPPVQNDPPKDKAKNEPPKEKAKNEPPADLPKDKDQSALKSAADVRDQKAGKHPAEDPNAPVKLRVLYDGKPVQIKVQGGKAFVPEPAEGQRVEFVIARDAKAGRYGVVLKVNGENTAEKQRLPDARCRKWILTDPGETITVRGYQIGTDRVETFRVLSVPESKASEVNYGADVGTLTLTVFPEGKAPAPDLAEDAAEKTAVAAADLPAEPSKSFDSLKAKLLEDANRGLIAEGAQVGGTVEVVKFTPAATPVMTLTVIYYKTK